MLISTVQRSDSVIHSFSYSSLFSVVAAPWHMEFPSQRSDPSHRRDLSNTGSLTHGARPGIEPASQRSQDAADPIAPQQEGLHVLL